MTALFWLGLGSSRDEVCKLPQVQPGQGTRGQGVPQIRKRAHCDWNVGSPSPTATITEGLGRRLPTWQKTKQKYQIRVGSVLLARIFIFLG